MIFKNWAQDGLDVYMRASRWEIDIWSHYTISDQVEPADWHKALTMTFIDNHVWTIEAISKKRKKESMESTSDDEEPMSEAATINEVAMNAMTPDVADAL